ncbi:hypothetical protein [Actinacidiphila yanglinensis]|uniref:hypothetical protein n=1 Tax=Actinacidiphila yanglinensis TaxID=310779 RepID=UPI00190E9CF4|nr:hypothetical protein [Actinacidiphila yanglinensis]
MSSGLPPNRREDEVRRLLDTPHPLLPADLAARAVRGGRRLLLHRRVVRYALCLLLLAAATTALVLAA